jgi:transposase-like protein
MPPKSRSERGRFSAKRKRETVLRLLRGEPLDELSRELGVNASTLAQWREAFLESGLAGLKSKQTDQRDDQIANLQRKIGAITMENDLLYEKIHKMEEGLPLARRRSKK